jgi:hypothetical protein
MAHSLEEVLFGARDKVGARLTTAKPPYNQEAHFPGPVEPPPTRRDSRAARHQHQGL